MEVPDTTAPLAGDTRTGADGGVSGAGIGVGVGVGTGVDVGTGVGVGTGVDGGTGVDVGTGVGEGGVEDTPLTKLQPFARTWDWLAQPALLPAFTHQ